MESAPGPRCPHCDALRVAGPECPRCGVIYARARPRVAVPVPSVTLDGPPPLDSSGVLGTPDPGASWEEDVEDARYEFMLRAVGPPVALLLLSLVIASSTGHAIVRTFLSMWVHELGHAVAALLCGHLAFPGPWRTFASDGRFTLVILSVAAAFGYLVWRGSIERRGILIVGGSAGLLTQLVCVLLPPGAASALVTFAGDGGALVIGTLLMSAVYARPESRLRQGALRWGIPRHRRC